MNRLWSICGKPQRISALTKKKENSEAVKKGGTAGIPVPCRDWNISGFFHRIRKLRLLYDKSPRQDAQLRARNKSCALKFIDSRGVRSTLLFLGKGKQQESDLFQFLYLLFLQ